MQHSIFGASSASRWFECPGSVNLSKDVERTTSSYAAEGTAAHALCEKLFEPTKPNLDKIEEIEGYKVNDEMREAAHDYYNYVSKNMGEYLQIEQTVNLSWLAPKSGIDIFGTTDAISWDDFGVLKVFDFKYGVRSVNPENNQQMLFYAVGAATKDGVDWGDFSHVELHVCQPRGGGNKVWECSIKHLKDFAELLRVKVKDALKHDAILKAGNHCFFCPAKPLCPKQKEKALKIAQAEFDDIPKLPISELAEMLKSKEDVVKYFTAIEELLFAEAKKGTKVPGFKIGQGKKNRGWGDAKEVEKILSLVYGKEIFTKALLKSVAQMEKVVPKEELISFIVTSSSEKLLKI